MSDTGALKHEAEKTQQSGAAFTPPTGSGLERQNRKGVYALLAVAIVVASAAPCVGADSPSTMTLLESFEAPNVVERVALTNARVSVVPTGATQGKQALRIDFLPSDSLSTATIKGIAPTDWSQFGQLIVDVTNLGEEPQFFGLRVDGPNGRQRSGSRELGSRLSATFTLSFADAAATGMRTPPVAAGTLAFLVDYAQSPFDYHAPSPFDFSRVDGLTFFRYGRNPSSIVIDNSRLAPPFDLRGLVDAYGQYTRSNWPGKIHGAGDLAAQRVADAKELSSSAVPPEADEFGGWKPGPKLMATGFFRTEKTGGKWWLVTPAGHLFFSLGMDCVGLQGSGTFIAGRESMFSWLPSKDSPLAKHVGQAKGRLGYEGAAKERATFNFFAANLERKYGPDYMEDYVPIALKRLRAWGFNTVAAWSDDPFCFNQRDNRIPYTVIVHPRSVPLNAAYGYTPDPFDPSFAQDTEEAIRAMAARVNGDPWCIGFFVDNEQRWWPYGVLRGLLANDAASSHGKRMFIDDLREKYSDIGVLNTAWNTRFESWETLAKPAKLEGRTPETRISDAQAFVVKAARKYFSVVKNALKAAAPNHLYLGCRFAMDAPEPVKALAAEFCDVVSVNIYNHSIGKDWSFLGGLDKPCLIGEFHFGALDRGMFGPGLVPANDQADRARKYAHYLMSALDQASLVGCHWFQYHDQPLTGRLDGENDNVGFVDIADTPYPELLLAAKEVHAAAYRRRASEPGPGTGR
ncbi:MAG: beta-galactosidase [Verrucomicrobia bacterium]|nr:beta-galactosidase [Verrucomicrobiota bacterium]